MLSLFPLLAFQTPEGQLWKGSQSSPNRHLAPLSRLGAQCLLRCSPTVRTSVRRILQPTVLPARSLPLLLWFQPLGLVHLSKSPFFHPSPRWIVLRVRAQARLTMSIPRAVLRRGLGATSDRPAGAAARHAGGDLDGAVRARMCRQHAVHDVLIDVDPERSRDDARTSWTAERGVRDVSATMAWRSASLGPFGPGCFGHSLDEHSRRYVRRTNA